MAEDKFRMTHHKRTTEIDFIAGVFLMMKLIFSNETPVSNYFAWFWKSKKVVLPCMGRRLASFLDTRSVSFNACIVYGSRFGHKVERPSKFFPNWLLRALVLTSTQLYVPPTNAVDNLIQISACVEVNKSYLVSIDVRKLPFSVICHDLQKG